MKNTKKLSLVLFLLTPITLTGCSGLFHLPGNVVSTSSVTTQKKLVLKSLPTADVYYVGQGFDFCRYTKTLPGGKKKKCRLCRSGSGFVASKKRRNTKFY